MTEPVTPIPDSEEGPVTFVDSGLKVKPPQPAISGRYRRSHRDGERWLWTIVVFFSAVILLTTISGQAVKNGDVAAWVSMLFNGVMATAAVGAYLTARKWVPQLTTQEGYKVAICLVNEHYIYLGIQNPLLRSTNQALSCYNEFLQIYNHTSSVDYARKIAILSRAILNEKERKDSIEQAGWTTDQNGSYWRWHNGHRNMEYKSNLSSLVSQHKVLLSKGQPDIPYRNPRFLTVQNTE